MPHVIATLCATVKDYSGLLMLENAPQGAFMSRVTGVTWEALRVRVLKDVMRWDKIQRTRCDFLGLICM